MNFKFWKGGDLPESYSHLKVGNYDPKEIQTQILAIVEPNGFKWRVFFVAASGFLTDAYCLFATNVIFPALAYIYWEQEDSGNRSLVINEVTLFGSCLGMLIFGNLADRYGRKRLYGVELVIVIIATLGITQASSGYNNSSMDIYPWIIFWRFLLGLGIGAEYPLSALIASEWSSTKSRGTMLAAVFLMQPVGQLAAYAVGLGALVRISADKHLNPSEVKHEIAAPVIDAVWRCVIGAGAVPALIAIAARLSIPETPRFLLEIENNPRGALKSADKVYKHGGSTETAKSVEPQQNKTGNAVEVEKRDSKGKNAVQSHAEIEPDFPEVTTRQPEIASGDEGAAAEKRSEKSGEENVPEEEKPRFPQFTWIEWNKFLNKGYGRFLAGTSICWFLLDMSFYGLGLDNPRTIAKIWAPEPTNTTHMFDWNSNLARPNETIYEALKGDSVRALFTISITSVLGSVCLLGAINYIPRVTFLSWTFVTLAGLFLVTGGSLIGVYETDDHSVAIVFYSLALLILNLGPNALTFILPAELFPTKYRGTCYGIAAASGKAGAIIIQIIVRFAGVTSPGKGKWPLSIMLMLFCPLMLLGALVAWVWIPEVQEPRDHEPQGPVERGEEHHPKRSFRDRLLMPNKSLEEIAESPTEGQIIGFRDNFRRRFRRLPEAPQAVVGPGNANV